MLEAAAKSAAIRDLLDDVTSVEEVKIFKVSPRVYNLAPERLNSPTPSLASSPRILGTSTAPRPLD